MIWDNNAQGYKTNESISTTSPDEKLLELQWDQQTGVNRGFRSTRRDNYKKHRTSYRAKRRRVFRFSTKRCSIPTKDQKQENGTSLEEYWRRWRDREREEKRIDTWNLPLSVRCCPSFAWKKNRSIGLTHRHVDINMDMNIDQCWQFNFFSSVKKMSERTVVTTSEQRVAI